MVSYKMNMEGKYIKDLVSIVIPIYNVEHVVENSLRSVLNQTYKNIEYILVDDCGIDSSMAIVERVIKEDAYCNMKIEIIRHKTNLGLSAARNTGLKESVGEFVFFVDSDDAITSNCIELHVNSIKSQKADFTISNIQLKGSRSFHVSKINKEVEDLPILESFLLRKWNVSAWNKLYRKSFLNKNKIEFVDGQLHEDILWTYKIVKNGAKAAFIYESTYLYIISRSNSITSRVNPRRIESLMSIIIELKSDLYMHGGHEDEFKNYVNILCFNTLLLIMNLNSTSDLKMTCYKKVSDLSYKSSTIYSHICKMSYMKFKLLIYPLYFMYKKIQKI